MFLAMIACLPAADVPAKFVYDPVAGESRRNEESRLCRKGESEAESVKPGPAGFTLELFVKPASVPTRSTYVMRLGSRGGDEVGLGFRRLGNFRQTYYGAFVRRAGGRPAPWSTGHYVTISRVRQGALTWRHLALVYDAAARTLTCYLDHWQAEVRKLDRPLKLDDPELTIGNFDGRIDEARFTPKPLTPAAMLWARGDELNGVSFQSRAVKLPPGTGYIDLKEGFGAVGDGKVDDTAAIQKAFAELANKVPGAYYTLYIPPGVYRVTDTCQCSRFFVIQGAGRDKTTIRLDGGAAGFGDPDKSRPVIRASSTKGPPGSNRRVNGSSIGIYVFDLTIDAGKNPGAKAIEYHSNNHGAMQRVALRGTGTVGLDLSHKTNGPALIKNVTIDGFDYGVTAAYMEYSMTLEHVRLRGQRKAGILNRGNILAMRDIRSENRCPAVVSAGGVSMIALLDSELTGGAGGPAVRAAGAAYLRNVRHAGYDELAAGDGKHANVIVDDGSQSLSLPVEEPPNPAWGDIAEDWVNVRDFAPAGRVADWTGPIQKAIDSGAKTVYFPQGGYPVLGTVHVRGRVERLFGMKSALTRPRKFQGDAPLLEYDDPSADRVIALERLEVHSVRHNSPGTLIMRHGSPRRYANAAGCGKLFLEDLGGTDYHFDHPQRVWVRQWNPEEHGPGPGVECRGVTLWCLGFKTEYESSKLWAAAGSRVEILGGFIYPVKKGIPRGRPVFKNLDSSMTLNYGMSVYVAGHDLQVLERAREVRMKDMKRVGARFRMDLYTSRAAK